MRKWLILTFNLACAYFFTGYFSHSFLAVDGYAVASWPPAGIALASFLIWGRKSALGIILGALLINFTHLDKVSDILALPVFLQAITIAIAATFQAWLGWILIVYVIKAPLNLSSLKLSMQSLIIAGPVCCIITAILGTGLLVFNNILPAHAAVDNFIAWWIGDSIGVFIFTPLLLAAFNYSQLRHRLQVIVPSLLIYILISVSFYGAASVKKEKDLQKQNAKIAFIQDEISNKVNEVTTHLALLMTFFSSSDHVSYKEFEKFTSKQLSYSEEIIAFEWIPYIPKNELKDYQAISNVTNTDNYFIKEKSLKGAWQPVGERDFYYPVKYISPLAGNENAVGFDLGSNLVREDALGKAKMLNELVISEPIDLVQSTASKGILFLQPVFGDEDEGSNFKGFVAAIVNLEKLSKSLLFNQKNIVKISFFDITNINNKQAIYTAPSDTLVLLKDYSLSVGKRTWQIQLHEEKVHTSWLLYWLAQIIGMLFVWLLMVFLILVTGTNIQIRKQVAKQTKILRKEKQKSDAASQIKSQFLANMSHEIRTPINGIKGLHYLALQKNDWQQAKSYIEQADGALSVLLRVLNDVLDFSKIEAGKLDLVQEPIDVGNLTDEMINLLQFDVNLKSLSLKLDYDKSSHLVIHTDPIRLKQVLLNLLSNAVKFTANGVITLKVWQSQQKTYFSINDTGIGINKEAQKQLFEPFSQADSSTSRQFGGTGLGLSICKKLVELMGGSIDLISDEGKGSTFTFCLPLQSLLPKAQKAQQLYDEIDVDSLSFTDYKLLLVEDNPLNQHVANAILKTKGCIADIAGDGIEAIEKLTEKSYDIVLMDIQMPKMDGLQATKVIREELGLLELPIIGLSANAHDDDITKAFECGMDNYITKPIDANSLFKTLWHHLSTK